MGLVIWDMVLPRLRESSAYYCLLWLQLGFCPHHFNLSLLFLYSFFIFLFHLIFILHGAFSTTSTFLALKSSSQFCFIEWLFSILYCFLCFYYKLGEEEVVFMNQSFFNFDWFLSIFSNFDWFWSIFSIFINFFNILK